MSHDGGRTWRPVDLGATDESRPTLLRWGATMALAAGQLHVLGPGDDWSAQPLGPDVGRPVGRMMLG